MFKIETTGDLSLNELRNRLFHYKNPKLKNTKIYSPDSLLMKCKERYDQSLDVLEKRFYYYLVANNFKNLKSILISTPQVLNKHKNELDQKVANNEIRPFFTLSANGTPVSTPFGQEILDLFGYSNFRKTKVFFDIYQTIGRMYCNYCNLEQTMSIEIADGRKSFFDCDHYFSKVKYPYLSVSFYNLIPSCTTCNSRIKSTRDLSLSIHSHPYINDIDKQLAFDTNIPFRPNLNFEITTVQEGLDNEQYEKAAETLKFFKILERYNHPDLKKEVPKLYEISQEYPLEQKKQKLASAQKLNPAATPEDVIRKILYTHSIPRNITEAASTSLGKLKLDFAARFKISKWE